jgi:hypothetical protein
MSKTVTSLFNTEAEAEAAIGYLEGAGISQGGICLFGKTGDDCYWTGSHQMPVETSPTYLDNEIVRYLTDNGVPDRNAHAYAEGAHSMTVATSTRASSQPSRA